MNMQHRESDNEAGYVLMAVIFLTMLLLMSLAIAAPKIAMSIQRDKELETIHRGQQYRRAIKLYYQKFGSYPTSIDQLVQTNQVRFLRKRYKDPLTGKDDWKPVYFGQAHVRPLGFFGQPLTTSAALGGIGASMYSVAVTTTTDANGVPIASPDGSATGITNGSNTQGTGSTSLGSGSSNSISSMFGQSSSSSGFGSPSSSGVGSSTGSQTGTSGTAGSGTSATTFGGGGPIVGFTLPVDKPSLVLYKQQKRYKQWEFNYDPAEDQAQQLAGVAGGAATTNLNGTNGNTPGTTTPGSIPSPPPTSNPPVSDPGSTGGTNPGEPPATPPTGPTDPTSPQ
jgi:hypothetical protein